MPMITNVSQSFSTIVECLTRSDYKRIQYFPTGRAQFIGREFLLMRSFLLKDKVIIFSGSTLQPLYELFVRNVYHKPYYLSAKLSKPERYHK